MDRISNLPHSIIQHILSFLPAKDAIKFCTLSRQWGSLWTSISNLLFYCESTEPEENQRFASFIDKTILKHAGSRINKFLVKFRYDHSLKEKVDSWVRFATTHNVRELCLDFESGGVHAMHETMCSNCTVTKMSLIQVDFYHFGRRPGIRWTSLKALSLGRIVRLEGDMIRSILLGSPFMECLTLRECVFQSNSVTGKFVIDATCTSLKELVIDTAMTRRVRGPIEIKGPNLLSLTVAGYMSRTGLKLFDVSSLMEANIDCRTHHSERAEDIFANSKRILKCLLRKLRHINKLTVGIRSLQVLSLLWTDECALSGTSTCKILKVNMKLEYLPGMAALLKSSPNLEQLTINIMPSHDSEIAGVSKYGILAEVNYWRLETNAFKCLIRTLKSIDIAGFVVESCSISEKNKVELVKFLLANAKVLEQLIIHVGPADSFERSWKSLPPENLFKVLEITQKLCYYPRASPNAVVEFKNHLH